MLHPETWISKYGDYLFSIALLKTSNKETAEDLVQESFLSAIKAKDSFRGESSEKTWLVSILNNKIMDYYRKKDVLKNTTEYLTDTNQSFSESFFGMQTTFSNAHWLADKTPKHWSSNADDRMMQSEFQQVLEKCIGLMPPKLAPVFISKFIDEEETEKICKDFEISSSNYWVIIHRAKLLIRSCLEKNWI